MKASRTWGAKSIDGALVKLSTMNLKTAAALKKLSTDPSSPSPVPRSNRVPIWVCRAPRLNKTQAFSNATVRWALGTPVKESYLQRKIQKNYENSLHFFFTGLGRWYTPGMMIETPVNYRPRPVKHKMNPQSEYLDRGKNHARPVEAENSPGFRSSLLVRFEWVTLHLGKY